MYTCADCHELNARFKDACESSLGQVQDAAGVFAELRDVVNLRVEAPRPVDISPECANMLERLCLAQAQELTFEKFRADGKNPSILARSRSLPWPPLRLSQSQCQRISECGRLGSRMHRLLAFLGILLPHSVSSPNTSPTCMLDSGGSGLLGIPEPAAVMACAERLLARRV